jgi:ketosteroid isomerase-like protein
MANNKVEMLHEGYAAFAAGDLARLSELFTEDVIWHTPGHHQLAGVFRGQQAVFAMFGQLAQLTDGTFEAHVNTILADDEIGFAWITTSATRGERTLDVTTANVFHFRGPQVAEVWLAITDPDAEEAFWG